MYICVSHLKPSSAHTRISAVTYSRAVRSGQPEATHTAAPGRSQGRASKSTTQQNTSESDGSFVYFCSLLQSGLLLDYVDYTLSITGHVCNAIVLKCTGLCTRRRGWRAGANINSCMSQSLLFPGREQGQTFFRRWPSAGGWRRSDGRARHGADVCVCLSGLFGISLTNSRHRRPQSSPPGPLR